MKEMFSNVFFSNFFFYDFERFCKYRVLFYVKYKKKIKFLSKVLTIGVSAFVIFRAGSVLERKKVLYS